MRRRVLITGDKGFIGSHFHRHLKEKGWSVFGFDIRGTYGIDAVEFFRHDRTHFDLVLHCAAAIPDLVERERDSMPVASNIALDSLYLQWALRTRPKKAVYFSSAAAYPIDLNLRGHALHEDDIDLDDLRQPDGMYGFAKLCGEVQVREAQRQGLDVLVVRPQTGYGLAQTPHYPLPAMVQRALNREDPFVIWGSGEQIRDPIYVDDIVEAIMAMLDADVQGPVNIGGGEPWSMTEMARLVCEAAGYTPELEFQLDKPEGSPARYAETTLMHNFYVPRITLKDGVRRMLQEVVRV